LEATGGSAVPSVCAWHWKGPTGVFFVCAEGGDEGLTLAEDGEGVVIACRRLLSGGLGGFHLGLRGNVLRLWDGDGRAGGHRWLLLRQLRLACLPLALRWVWLRLLARLCSAQPSL
jgi:hypothetical protein